jgi:hypothetical protein
MFNTLQWLLEGEPWVRYRTMVDILGKPVNNDEVLKTKAQILNDPKIQTILAELAEWPSKRLTSHKSADHPIHKLSFIADIGLDAEIPQIKANLNGQFTPESIWKAWSDYDFGQKKQPSRWMTLLALRILNLNKIPDRNKKVYSKDNQNNTAD